MIQILKQKKQRETFYLSQTSAQTIEWNINEGEKGLICNTECVCNSFLSTELRKRKEKEREDRSRVHVSVFIQLPWHSIQPNNLNN